MSYLVFARKFRPRTFAEVTGQDSAITTLRNALASGRIAHAFCFAGPRGIGKTTTARLLAKALNCAQGPTAEPCGECDSCREIHDGRSLDVIEIDGASNRKVEDVESIRQSVQYNPARDRFKVVIIDEVHMLSGHAFNALLKTLEEPPEHVKFIFATTELHKLPATILSRCQVYEFRRISFKRMVERLRSICERESLEATDDALALVARNSEGCMRDAESALDQVVSFGGELTAERVTEVLGLIAADVLFEATDAILAEDSCRVLEIIDRVVDGGIDPRRFLARLGEHLRDLLVSKVTSNPAGIVVATGNHLERLRTQADQLSEEECLRLLNLAGTAEEPMRRTSAPRFLLEATALKMVQARRLVPLPRIIERLGGLPAAPTGPTPASPTAPAAASASPAAAGITAGTATGAADAAGGGEIEAPGLPLEGTPPPRPSSHRRRPTKAKGEGEVATSPAASGGTPREALEMEPTANRLRELFRAEVVEVEPAD